MRWILVFHEYCATDTVNYDYVPYIAAVVKADTRRKAQNEVKKLYPNIRLYGKFAARLIEFPSPQSQLYTQKADGRLNRYAIHLHRASLEQLS